MGYARHCLFQAVAHGWPISPHGEKCGLALLVPSRGTPKDKRGCLAVAIILAATFTLLAAGGCSSSPVSLRSVPKSPLINELNLASYGGPKPSARTVQLLRVYNLSDDLNGDYSALLKQLQAISDREPAADTVYALAELAFLAGKKTERHDSKAALDLYGALVLHAYDYLFDPRFAASRNQYDPEYRGACDLYNGALESALRIVCADEGTEAQHHQDDQHRLGRVGHQLRAEGGPLAAARFRAVSNSSPTMRSRG